MKHTVTLIPGDGIGPEVSEAVVRILDVAGVDIEWDRRDAGATAYARTGDALPPSLLDSVRRHKVALKGPIATPIAGGYASVNVGLRKALDLYANLRPVVNLPGVRSRFERVRGRHLPGTGCDRFDLNSAAAVAGRRQTAVV